MTNGKVERWHRVLKTAIMAQARHQWVDALPTVLLGLHAMVREDVKVSPAEMVYGTTLRLPGDFFESSLKYTDPISFVTQLKERMQVIRPIPTVSHTRAKIFVTPQLRTCSHVFLRVDSVKKPLQPPFEGPFPVIKRFEKYFTVNIRGRETNISIDRLKPAFFLAVDPTLHDHSYA
ncbi:hypothetical protein ABEB36_015372 [Hypothenemus hampei]|uniref:Uncharacterized protein n=1 Tax=Hypothenemus hampei TaxID=57062 RepID=A0ABD1E003_HYPHA